MEKELPPDVASPAAMATAFAKYIMTVDMFPVFFFAHFIMASILVREDSKTLGHKFRQRHPGTSWLCTIIASLSGGFVASFLFGESLVDNFKEHALVAFATVIWYMINFSPFDIAYKVALFRPVFLCLTVLQECLRLRFLYLGLQAAANSHPNSYLIILIGGIIKGNGYGFLKIAERLIRGIWDPNTNEILQISFFTKSGIYASLLFLLHHIKMLRIPIELLYFGILAAFIVGRLSTVLLGLKNPFKVIEAPICRLLFGDAGDGTEKKTNPPKAHKAKGDKDKKKD